MSSECGHLTQLSHRSEIPRGELHLKGDIEEDHSNGNAAAEKAIRGFGIEPSIELCRGSHVASAGNCSSHPDDVGDWTPGVEHLCQESERSGCQDRTLDESDWIRGLLQTGVGGKGGANAAEAVGAMKGVSGVGVGAGKATVDTFDHRALESQECRSSRCIAICQIRPDISACSDDCSRRTARSSQDQEGEKVVHARVAHDNGSHAHAPFWRSWSATTVLRLTFGDRGSMSGVRRRYGAVTGEPMGLSARLWIVERTQLRSPYLRVLDLG